MIQFLSILFKLFKWFILLFLLLISGYLILAIILSVIPVNTDFESDDSFEIYIKSNGIHICIVLPVQNEIKNWSTELQIDDRVIDWA